MDRWSQLWKVFFSRSSSRPPRAGRSRKLGNELLESRRLMAGDLGGSDYCVPNEEAAVEATEQENEK